MDEVTVTMLPHPITTFILGITLVALIYLFFEAKRLHAEIKMLTSHLHKVEDRLDRMIENGDVRLEEVSKKIDSRVDKAISALKKELKA